MIELKSPDEANDRKFGLSVSGIPDLSGDGYGDVVVGAPFRAAGALPPPGGRAYVFNGKTGGLIRALISPNAEDDGRFGYSVSGIQDVNGDGLGDVIVGAYLEGQGMPGRAYIFCGTTGTPLHTLVSPNPQWGGYFGWSVSDVPDVNGDGFDDVIVGACQENPGGSPTKAGRAYVFSGLTGGPPLHTLISPNEDAYGKFGSSVAGVADVNGDGRGDVIVGAFQENPGGSPTDAGRAYIFSGSTGAWHQTLISPNEQDTGWFGHSVAALADVSDDGRGDVIVGAKRENPGGSPSEAGRAYIVSGSDGEVQWTLNSPNEQWGGYFGHSVSSVNDPAVPRLVVVGAIGEPSRDSLHAAGRVHLFAGGTCEQTLVSPNEEEVRQFRVLRVRYSRFVPSCRLRPCHRGCPPRRAGKR